MGLSTEQYEVLVKPINTIRIAKRRQSGKDLSYLESWDVRAHLIRVFGYGGFDIEVLDYRHVTDRAYGGEDRPMVEVIYSAHVQLIVRDPGGVEVARYSEVACGSASGPMTMLGEQHDNAVKTAVSDATKRCAINLGNQFGLSLYDQGSTRDVIRKTLVVPTGYVEPDAGEVDQALAHSLGASDGNDD